MTAPVPSAALAAEAVTRRFGRVAALDGVSLEIARGECVALVGESGSGKSTLLRCFNRLVDPDGGRIAIDGADVRTLDPVGLRRKTGYVPQEGGLLPHWTVIRNVALVPWLARQAEGDALARDALTLVGLDPATFGARWPHELSGGQRQRAAMARALAARPAAILLDEPFGALDAITRAELQATFIEVRRSRVVTAVIVTHDLHEAIRLADRVAVMRRGRLEQVATPEALVEAPATDYVARLLARSRVLRAEVESS